MIFFLKTLLVLPLLNLNYLCIIVCSHSLGAKDMLVIVMLCWWLDLPNNYSHLDHNDATKAPSTDAPGASWLEPGNAKETLIKFGK